MKLYSYLSAILLLVATSAVADVYIMKDGRKIEGTLVRETETIYVVEIQVTQSIKDERKLLKADVASIKKAQVDLELFEEIEKMVPTPDAMPNDEYEKRIKEISRFLVEHQNSSKANAARDILVELRSELNLLNDGGVKIGGLMLTAEQRKANAYDIDAQVEALHLKRMIADRQLLPALRAFRQFERDYRLSESYAALLPDIRKVISSYAGGVYQSLQSYDQRVEQRELGLTQMSKEDRRISEQAIADQTAALEQRYAAEKAAKIQWVSVHPFCKEALDYTLNLAKSESKRLDGINAIPSVDGGKLFRELKGRFEKASDERVRKKLLHDAKRVGFSEKYVELLQSYGADAKDPAEEPKDESVDKPAEKHPKGEQPAEKPSEEPAKESSETPK